MSNVIEFRKRPEKQDASYALELRRRRAKENSAYYRKRFAELRATREERESPMDGFFRRLVENCAQQPMAPDVEPDHG